MGIDGSEIKNKTITKDTILQPSNIEKIDNAKKRIITAKNIVFCFIILCIGIPFAIAVWGSIIGGIFR